MPRAVFLKKYDKMYDSNEPSQPKNLDFPAFVGLKLLKSNLSASLFKLLLEVFSCILINSFLDNARSPCP